MKSNFKTTLLKGIFLSIPILLLAGVLLGPTNLEASNAEPESEIETDYGLTQDDLISGPVRHLDELVKLLRKLFRHLGRRLDGCVTCLTGLPARQKAALAYALGQCFSRYEDPVKQRECVSISIRTAAKQCAIQCGVKPSARLSDDEIIIEEDIFELLINGDEIEEFSGGRDE